MAFGIIVRIHGRRFYRNKVHFREWYSFSAVWIDNLATNKWSDGCCFKRGHAEKWNTLFVYQNTCWSTITQEKWRQLNEPQHRNITVSTFRTVLQLALGCLEILTVSYSSYAESIGNKPQKHSAILPRIKLRSAAYQGCVGMNQLIWSDVNFWPNFAVRLSAQAEKTRLMCW